MQGECHGVGRMESIVYVRRDDRVEPWSGVHPERAGILPAPGNHPEGAPDSTTATGRVAAFETDPANAR
jgi:hypothetical protein